MRKQATLFTVRRFLNALRLTLVMPIAPTFSL